MTPWGFVRAASHKNVDRGGWQPAGVPSRDRRARDHSRPTTAFLAGILYFAGAFFYVNDAARVEQVEIVMED